MFFMFETIVLLILQRYGASFLIQKTVKNLSRSYFWACPLSHACSASYDPLKLTTLSIVTQAVAHTAAISLYSLVKA
jgi:hypothetical protein